MTGSTKQINWASTIRTEIIEGMPPVIVEYFDQLSAGSAKWWIDHRDDDFQNTPELLQWLEDRPNDPAAKKYLETLSRKIVAIHNQFEKKGNELNRDAKHLEDTRFQIAHQLDTILWDARQALDAERRKDVNELLSSINAKLIKLKEFVEQELPQRISRQRS